MKKTKQRKLLLKQNRPEFSLVKLLVKMLVVQETVNNWKLIKLLFK